MGKKSREKKERGKQEMDTLFTIKEAAEYLKVHHVTIRNRIKKNHIKALDISRPGAKQKEYRITRQELERIIS